MGKKSINGWPVIPTYGDVRLRTGAIPGADRRLTIRREALPLFLALAADYHRWVKPLDKGTWDEGGYNNRLTSRGAISNHASATAMDLNWSREGRQGSTWGRRFFGKERPMRAINRLKKIYPIFNWGGDWHMRDYMHWELRPGTTMDDVNRLTKKLGIKRNGVRTKNRFGLPILNRIKP